MGGDGCLKYFKLPLDFIIFSHSQHKRERNIKKGKRDYNDNDVDMNGGWSVRPKYTQF